MTTGKKKRIEIHFVTWPNGTVISGPETYIGEREAVACAVASFLPSQWFPDVDFSGAYHGGGLSQLWRAMQQAGFKLQSVSADVEGVSA